MSISFRLRRRPRRENAAPRKPVTNKWKIATGALTVKSNVLRLPSQARALPPGAVALRRARFALGWSQERMAQHLGVDVKTYRNRETARVVDPVFDGYVALLSAKKEAA